MPILLFILGLALQGDPSADACRARAHLMRDECAAALESEDGVTSVGVGGSGMEYRLLIAVRDAAAQRRVRDLVGDTYGGFRIVWSIPSPRPAAQPAPPDAAPERLRPPMPPPESFLGMRGGPSMLDCDIIRDYLKLKPVSHPVGNGKSWVPCRVTRRTTLGPGGVTSFSYTDHRPDCPIRLGRVGEPPGSDNFIAWVFRQGITPPSGGSFTLPSNDWAWGVQAAADMASRLPSIREADFGPVWIGGYGWVYSSYWHSAPYYPWRPCWRPHFWIPLGGCHRWHRCR